MCPGNIPINCSRFLKIVYEQSVQASVIFLRSRELGLTDRWCIWKLTSAKSAAWQHSQKYFVTLNNTMKAITFCGGVQPPSY